MRHPDAPPLTYSVYQIMECQQNVASRYSSVPKYPKIQLHINQPSISNYPLPVFHQPLPHLVKDS